MDRLEELKVVELGEKIGYKKGFEDAKKQFERPHGEWLDDVCSCCGMESEYQTLYCGGCGVLMKNGFPSCGYGEARKGG